jgi:hypothetical protein
MVVEEMWNQARVKDPMLLERLCNRYGFDPDEMRAKINTIEYREGEREVRGEPRPVIFVRTRGNGRNHELIKGKDGVWYCNCPAWVFKGGRDELKPCKHLVSAIVSGLGDPSNWMQYLV